MKLIRAVIEDQVEPFGRTGAFIQQSMEFQMRRRILEEVASADNGDVRLLYRVEKRDQVALEEMYRLYYPKLSRFLLSILGTSAQQALPELINEVMLVVWNKAESFNHNSKVSSWIFGIALRIAKKHLSKQSHYNKRLKLFAEETEVTHTEHWESNLESSELLTKALRQLTYEQKAVVELTYFNGLHYSEIAEIMDCPENTVKTRMFHAKKKLRTVVRDLSNVRKSG